MWNNIDANVSRTDDIIFTFLHSANNERVTVRKRDPIYAECRRLTPRRLHPKLNPPGQEPPVDVHTPEITPSGRQPRAPTGIGVDHAVTYILLLLLLHTSKSLPLIQRPTALLRAPN